MNPSLAVEVFDTLHELQHLFRSRMRKSMEAVHPDLTFNEMRVLMRAGRHPGLTQRDLVENSHADKAQMARVLAHLQDRGLLTRSASKADKRVRCLHLSEQGQKVFARMRGLQERVAAELLADCAPSFQGQLLASLREVRTGAIARAEMPVSP